MRISELAALAGVTVRTIRYYHQVGILPEPRRRANGYRDYTVDDLVTILTITQLAQSGLSLEQAGAVAADAEPTQAALDEVDRALEARIATLTEQRERLAQARAGGHLGLSAVAAALRFSAGDLPIAILLAHLYQDDPRMGYLADALLEPEFRSAVIEIQERFDAIDDSTSDAQLEEMGTRMLSMVSEFVGEFPPLSRQQTNLILAVAVRDLNDRQKEYLRSLR